MNFTMVRLPAEIRDAVGAGDEGIVFGDLARRQDSMTSQRTLACSPSTHHGIRRRAAALAHRSTAMPYAKLGELTGTCPMRSPLGYLYSEALRFVSPLVMKR